MGELSATVLAAEEGGGQSNFLIPNGTFFVVLAIFLIVLAVIAKWVVPPVSKVLAERVYARFGFPRTLTACAVLGAPSALRCEAHDRAGRDAAPRAA